MFHLSFLVFVLLWGNTLTMAAWIIRVDSRDPDVLSKCKSFKLHCPQKIPKTFKPFHYMENNLADIWGATWNNKRTAASYIARYAPYSDAWIYYIEVKPEDFPEDITYQNQPDISEVKFYKVIKWENEAHGSMFQIPNPHYRPGFWPTIRKHVLGSSNRRRG
ncbi:hypothetical protein PspLS_10063 [Pyricularia sp. CBS 133598]|nr:hypothetical protein PspLS_10063 [Pyricularia sp. CBS 133598]